MPQNPIQNGDETVSSLLYLTACALHDIKPDLSRIDVSQEALTRLYALSCRHFLDAMTAYALEDAGIHDDRFSNSLNRSTYRSMLFDAETASVTGYFESAGIWYMPLKGTVIKGLYPKTGMREMSDVDILIDAEKRKDVQKYMKKLGYSCEITDQAFHDAYYKSPVFNFEMHFRLYANANHEEWTAYYSDVKNRLVKTSDRNYAYHFTPEDFYLFMILHGYKHYEYKQTALRFLVDVYLWIINHTLNFGYIEAETKKLLINDFEQTVRTLSCKLFENPSLHFELNEDETIVIQRLLHAFDNLTDESENLRDIQGDDKPIHAGTRIKRSAQIAFPKRDSFKYSDPGIYNHPWLLPVGWTRRYAKYIRLHGIKGVFDKVNSVWKTK